MIAATVDGRASEALGFLDDLVVDHDYALGTVSINLEAALAFAEAYDPFSFHLDPEKAKSSLFGGLVVSGLQTMSAIHALSIVGGFLREDSIVCGAGIDELRFLLPVRPDDRLTVTAKVMELKPPREGRSHGIARLKYWVRNQSDAVVMTFIDNHVVRTRQGGASP